MEIVIEIPEKVYGLLKYFEGSLGFNDEKDSNDDVKTALMRAVVHGTPLPEHHGDLIDRSKICKAIPAEEDNCTGMGMTYDEMDAYNDGIDSMWDKLQNANPVIKADKGSDSE